MEQILETSRLIDILPDLVCIAGTDGYFKFLNPEWEKTLGYSLEELFSRPLFDFIHPDDLEATQREIDKQLHGGATPAFVNRYRCKDGSYKVLEWRATPVEGEKLYAVARDITESKKTLESPEHTEKNLRSVLENLKLIAVSLNTHGHITFCNDYLLHLTGWKREEIMGENWFSMFLPPEIKDEIEKSVFSRTIQTNSFPAHYQNEILTKEGERRLIKWSNSGYFDSQGNVLGVTSIGEDITERVQIEEKLLESEAKYRAIFETNTSVKLIIDPEGGSIIDANEAACDFYGYPKKKMMTLNISAINIALPEKIEAEIQKAKSTNTLHSFSSHRLKTGEMRDVEVYSAPIIINNKTALYSIIHDITDRLQTEKAVREKELQYRLLFNSATDAIFVRQPGPDCSASNFIEANELACKMYGYSREELLCRTPLDVAASGQELVVHEQFKKLQSDKFNVFEMVHKTKEGEEFPVEISCHFFEMNGVPTILSHVRDISDRKKAEEKLLQNKNRFETLFNHSPVPLWEQDYASLYQYFDELKNIGINNLREYLDKHPSEIRKCAEKVEIKDVNQAALILHHASNKAELLNGLNEIFTEQSLDAYKNQLVAIFEGKSHFEGEGEVKTLTGEKKHVFVKLKIDNTEKTPPTALVATLDITERKKMEKLLQQSEARYRSMMESMVDPLYICSAGHKIQYMNPAMIRQIGRNRVGEECYRVLHGLDEQCDWCQFEKVTSGRVFETTIVSPRNNRHYRIQNMPINYGNGSVAKMSIYRDITEYKIAVQENDAAKARLMQSQKLDAIGTLAGGIAHDFNNILSAILGFTELSLDLVEKGSTLEDNLNEVFTAGVRAKELVNQILAFSRQSEDELQPMRVDTIVSEALKLIRSTIPTSIEIIQHSTSASHILGHPSQIHQVVMNLCANAAYAMEKDGGVLELTLKDVMVDDTLVKAEKELPPGKYMQLRVSDTGSGIPAEIISSIFEPYFTTKPFGEGTGMGLAVIHGIVESHGGNITVESSSGSGTVFTLHFPVVAELKSVVHDQKKAALSAGTERILFVDDDASITDVGKKMLESLGYQVTTRNSPMEALDLFRSRPYDFDLVFSDMTMPIMTGDKLAAELMRIRPDIPVVLCTGYSKYVTEQSVRAAGIRALLNKPLVLAELAATTRKVLDEVEV